MRLVHIDNDSFDWDAANGLLEEDLLDGLRRDGTQGRQQNAQFSEPERLRGIRGGVVFAKRQLSLVLEGDDLLEVF